jgi:hypothetical protein
MRQAPCKESFKPLSLLQTLTLPNEMYLSAIEILL